MKTMRTVTSTTSWIIALLSCSSIVVVEARTSSYVTYTPPQDDFPQQAQNDINNNNGGASLGSGGVPRRLNTWTDTWSAVVTASDSTATVDGKCRDEDGDVITIPEYRRGGKMAGGKMGGGKMSGGKMSGGKMSGGKMSGDGGKMSGGKMSGQRCADGSYASKCPPTASPTAYPTTPTMSPTDAPTASPTAAPTGVTDYPTASPSITPTDTPTMLPTAHPTKCNSKYPSKDCFIKTKKDKSMSMKHSKKSMMGSMGSKKSEKMDSKKDQQQNYEGLYIPNCSDFDDDDGDNKPPTSAPTVNPDKVASCASTLDGTVDTTGKTASQILRVWLTALSPTAPTFTDEEKAQVSADLTALIREIAAKSLGCDVRRRLSEERAGRRLAGATAQVDDVAIYGSQEAYCMDAGIFGNGGTCTLSGTMVNVYDGETSGFLANCLQYQGKFLEVLDDYGATKVNCVVDNYPFEKYEPTASPTASPTATPTDENGNRGAGGGAGGSTGGSTGDNVVAGISDNEALQTNDREGLSAGGFIGLAGAFLILILLLLLFVRRRKNKDKDAARMYAGTDDDEEASNFIDDRDMTLPANPNPATPQDDEDDISDYQMPGNRLAHVVGEDDSQYTGTSWGDNKERMRIERVRSVPEPTFSDQQPIEVGMDKPHDIGQTCSSPSCKICESRRGQGASTKFVKNRVYNPNPGYQDRDYVSSDTVDL